MLDMLDDEFFELDDDLLNASDNTVHLRESAGKFVCFRFDRVNSC